MKVLWVSDGVIPTGFSRVAHNLIGRAPREIEIHHLAINYYGDPHKYHYPIYPAFTGGDVYGFGRLAVLIRKLKPDVVFLFNDVPIISQYLKVLFAEQIDIPVFVYYPVDSKYLDPEWFELYSRYVQKLFVYTKFGYNETKRILNGIEPIIIPHGVDKNTFHKLPDDIVQEAKEKIGKDKFIILNANRNQPRKRIDITIRAFAEFAKDKDDVALYLHMGLVDAGWDILKLAKRFGIEDKLIITNKERGVQTIPDDQLNLIYNIADVGVNTSEGEGWGLCVHPDTIINTEKGFIPIKDITIGDKVLTKSGVYKEVIGKTSRTSSMWEVRVLGNIPIKVTKEHPFLVLNPDGSIEWKRVSELKRMDYVSIPVDKYDEPLPEVIDIIDFVDNIEYNDNFVWKKFGYSGNDREMSISTLMRKYETTKKIIENAKKRIKSGELYSNTPSAVIANRILGDYGENVEFNSPVKVSRYIKIDDNFLSLLGWYLAEGSYHRGKFSLALSYDELPVAEKFKEYIERTFGCNCFVRVNDEKTKSELICTNSVLGELFHTLGGAGAHNKKLHDVFYKTKDQRLLLVVYNYLLGDGHKNKKTGNWSAVTVSRDLAFQIVHILRRFGIFPSIKKFISNNGFSVGSTMYRIDISGHQLIEFNKLIGINDKDYGIKRKRANHYKIVGDMVFARIRSITKDVEYGEVFDIHVKDDHSFEGNGVLLHNTNFEMGSIGKPQVVPNNSASAEIFENSGVVVDPVYPKIAHGTNTEFSVVDYKAVANAFQQLYDNQDYYYDVAAKTENQFATDYYNWNRIADKFWQNFL